MMRYFLQILLIFNILYIAIFLYYGYWNAHQDVIFTDGGSYLQAGHYFFNKPQQVSAIRPYINGVYFGFPLIFREGIHWQRTYIFVMQYSCWLGTLGLAYWFLKKIHARFVGWILIGMGLNISFMIQTSFIASEPPATLLILGSFVSWYLAHRAEKPLQWLNVSLLCLTLATLIRSQTQYLLILLTLYGLWRAIGGGKKYFTKQLVCFVGIWLLAGWQIAQMNTQHHIKTISVIGDYDMYIYLENYATVAHVRQKSLRDSLIKTNITTRWREISDMQNQSYAGTAAIYARTRFLDSLKKHPIRVLCSWIRNVLSNGFASCDFLESSDDWFTRLLKAWTRIYNITLTFGILLGIPMLYAWKRNHLKINVLWLGSWFFCTYCVLTTGIAFGAGDRLHLIFFPIAVLGLSAFAQDFWLKPNSKSGQMVELE